MIIQMALFVGLVVLVMSFYWTRVLFGALMLGAWGLVAVVAPVYFLFDNLRSGNILSALILVVACTPVFGCWLIAVNAAREWYRQQIKWDSFKQPWNAR